MEASEAGHNRVVKLLQPKDVWMTMPLDQRLNHAAIFGDEETVRELLKTATAEEMNWKDKVSF